MLVPKVPAVRRPVWLRRRRRAGLDGAFCLKVENPGDIIG